LLEVGELGDFLPVQEDLPADPPGAEGGGLPVVFLESHVVGGRIDSQGDEASQVEVLDVGRGGFQDHLELVMLVEPVRVLAVAPVARPPGRLHVGDPPGIRAEDAEERLGMHRPRPHLGIPGLVDETPALGPVALEGGDHLLEGHPAWLRATSLSTRPERKWRSRC
jgi:hypothetical protein